MQELLLLLLLRALPAALSAPPTLLSYPPALLFSPPALLFSPPALLSSPPLPSTLGTKSTARKLPTPTSLHLRQSDESPADVGLPLLLPQHGAYREGSSRLNHPTPVGRRTWFLRQTAVSSSDGRCTEALDAAAQANPCNINTDQQSCTTASGCTWKYANDTCYCTFSGCTCGNPASGAEQSSPWSPQTLLMVIVPTLTVCGCLCTACCAYRFRRLLAKLFRNICPQVILDKVDLKDADDNADKHREVKTEEEELRDFQKAAMRREDQGIGNGSYQINIFIDYAVHLPIRDSMFRDLSALGSSDPYIIVRLNDQVHRTKVMRGTLYPEWKEEFSLFFDPDPPRRRPQTLSLELWDWDRGTKDQFCGSVTLVLADLLREYEKRENKSRPLEKYKIDPMKNHNGTPLTGGILAQLKRKNKFGKVVGEPTELCYTYLLDKTYNLRDAVGDLRRAVNWLRTEHSKHLLIKAGKYVEGSRPIDPHTGMERWEHTSTDLLHAEFAFDQSRGHDLWGIQDLADETKNPFLLRAMMIRAEREGAEMSPDERLESAIQMKDLVELKALFDDPALSGTARSKARRYIELFQSQGAARAEAAAREAELVRR
eukprot:754153-Hanusia_phi.AAC.3